MLRGPPCATTGLPEATSEVFIYREPAAKRVVGEMVEVGAVENIEDLPPELNRKALADLRVFDDRHVPLAETRTTQHVPPRIANRARRKAYRKEIWERHSLRLSRTQDLV